MDDRAREKAKQIVRDWSGNNAIWIVYDHQTDLEDRITAAISALCDEREREALERAAKVAEDHHNSHPDAICGITIATIIRSLIKTAPEGEKQ